LTGIEKQQQTLQALSKEELYKLLEMRRLKKQKTPDFQRQESWRYSRIHEPWRKPKGVDSHMRLSIKGWPALVKIGYRVPKMVRGLHPSGYRDVLVHNLAELETLSKDTDAARLASSVGLKKRIEIAKRAKELGIRVLNGRGLLGAQGIEDEQESTGREEKKEEQAIARAELQTQGTTATQKVEQEKKKRARKPRAAKKKKSTAKKQSSSSRKKKTKKKKE
jgi:large subunit ribosomal protein L32e